MAGASGNVGTGETGGIGIVGIGVGSSRHWRSMVLCNEDTRERTPGEPLGWVLAGMQPCAPGVKLRPKLT